MEYQKKNDFNIPTLYYSICSLCSASQLASASAELELMIRVSLYPWIFGGKPSASVRGSQEFLRICVRS